MMVCGRIKQICLFLYWRLGVIVLQRRDTLEIQGEGTIKGSETTCFFLTRTSPEMKHDSQTISNSKESVTARYFSVSKTCLKYVTTELGTTQLQLVFLFCCVLCSDDAKTLKECSWVGEVFKWGCQSQSSTKCRIRDQGSKDQRPDLWKGNSQAYFG